MTFIAWGTDTASPSHLQGRLGEGLAPPLNGRHETSQIVCFYHVCITSVKINIYCLLFLSSAYRIGLYLTSTHDKVIRGNSGAAGLFGL